jgi:DNA processing protein
MMSVYAQKILDALFQLLPWRDIVTISGWAEWVDTYAHTLSMKYNIPTIVVLGWWIGHYLNSGRNAFLEKVVALWWLVLSDYKLFYSPQTFTFPARNRIIAWLSKALFVPEAAEKSWSLITVDVAHKLQIPIYAPMQDVFCETSLGTNRYIQQWIIRPLHDIEICVGVVSPLLSKDATITQPIFDNMKQEIALPSSLISQDDLIKQSLQELGIC